jgi:hypothetical protein
MTNTISDSEQRLWDEYCQHSGESFDSVYRNKQKIQEFRNWFNTFVVSIVQFNDIYEDYMDKYINLLKYIGHYND